MAIEYRFKLRRRTSSGADWTDLLHGEMATVEPTNAFWYGWGNAGGGVADENRVIFYSDGARLWHDTIGAADGSTVFVGDGSGLTGVAAASVAWNNIGGKPSTFPPAAHTHPASEISDSTASGRALLTGVDAAAQRTSLGLGTAAVANVTTSATDTTAGRVLRVGDSATILSASPALRATVGGTGNAIALTTGANLPSLPTGLILRWRAGSANTGAATINVDGLGAQPCVTVTGAALPAGYIRTDVDTFAEWDGTSWTVDRKAEAGSNSDGEWRRTADGWQECARTVDIDGMSISTALGSLFRSNSDLGPYAFPVPFAGSGNVYAMSITISGSDNSAIRTGAICGRFRRASSTKTLAWAGISIISATSATGTAGEITRIGLSATGRWY